MKRWLAHITHYDKILKHHNKLASQTDAVYRMCTDILMAQIFHDSVVDYDWFRYKSLSPGRAAVDYACCYTIARSLNAMRPKHILECGLGQSSRIIHQYAAFAGASAMTCEHDEAWIDFFSKEVADKYVINVQKVDLETKKYKGEDTLTYANMQHLVKGEKFDYIFIDGPFGSSHYSRSQIIELCQNNLADRFCIVIDDTERMGEKETVVEVRNVLSQNNIPFSYGEVVSTKNHSIICSQELHFLTTM